MRWSVKRTIECECRLTQFNACFVGLFHVGGTEKSPRPAPHACRKRIAQQISSDAPKDKTISNLRALPVLIGRKIGAIEDCLDQSHGKAQCVQPQRHSLVLGPVRNRAGTRNKCHITTAWTSTVACRSIEVFRSIKNRHAMGLVRAFMTPALSNNSERRSAK